MTRQTFYLHQYMDDFDEFCANARNWDIDFRQLDAGPFSSELLMFGDASTLFTRTKLGRNMLQQGACPQGLVTFGILADPKINMHWRNIDVFGDMLVIFPPEGELQGITQADFDVFAISLAEDLLDQSCAAFELPTFNSLRIHQEAFQCHSQSITALRKWLITVEQTLTSGPWAIRNRGYLEQIEQEIAGRLVRILAEHRQPINRKRIRKRDLALKAAETYIFASTNAVVTIPELCIAANASERTLEYAFRERYGLTPKAYTQIYRLNNIRKQLRQASPDTDQVSEIAHQHGFWHMSQFSADYKKLFAELPSKTLKREV